MAAKTSRVRKVRELPAGKAKEVYRGIVYLIEGKTAKYRIVLPNAIKTVVRGRA